MWNKTVFYSFCEHPTYVVERRNPGAGGSMSDRPPNTHLSGTCNEREAQRERERVRKKFIDNQIDDWRDKRKT